MSSINPDIKSILPTKSIRTKSLSYYVNGIVQDQDLYILSESITLLESEQPEHRNLALDILTKCYDHRVDSYRYGITGSPGVGKSTFIDSIVGQYITDGFKVGVLTVDPSSTDGKGSILGDKTRMSALIQNDIFIRPSPSNRHLGGLNQFTYEAIILCEAAGMNRIFIETVGIGQSEVEVSRLVDATILLVLPGSGDSLQGIKKGVLEKADLVIINKSDGDSVKLAKSSARDFAEALHLKRGGNPVSVINYSSLSRQGRSEVIRSIQDVVDITEIPKVRKEQEQLWLSAAINEFAFKEVKKQMDKPEFKNSILDKVEDTSPFNVLSYLRDRISIHIDLKGE